MARTKRKVNPVLPVQTVTETKITPAYRTAGYIRLSLEDSGKAGSDTLDSQKKYVQEYISRQADMELTELFCDNGHTGTNFDRPQFDRMMEAVRRGEINCIVCKDLPRFGRNYKETGNYLERIFPFLDVRFIAINDNFDTLTAERNEFGFIVPLKNLMNETYSRDISRKVSSALEAKEKRGEFIGVYPTYGYSKSESDRHKLVVNPDTAPVVQQIFRWRCEGMGYGAIAKKLNDSGIPSPGAYLCQIGLSTREDYRKSLWAVWNIKDILNKQEYLGHLVQGKRTNESYKQTRKGNLAPESEWRIFKNAHEPIIDEETFRLCQAMAEKSRSRYNKLCGNSPAERTQNLFARRIFCADCGKTLSRRLVYSNWREEKSYYYNYLCMTSIKKTGACTPKNLMEKDLLAVVTDSVRCYIEAITELESRIQKIWQEKQAAVNQQSTAQLSAVQQEIIRLQSLHDGLYQNLIDGIINRQEYLAMKERYQNLLTEANHRLDALNAEQKEAARYAPDNPLFSLKRELQEGYVLSAELVNALIARIDVGDNDRIHITFNYQDEFEALRKYAEETEAK